MKYLKKACAFAMALLTTLCLFACGSKAELSSFNVTAKDSAYLGDTYTILEVVAKDSDGKEYFPTVGVTCEGEEVVVTNNSFNVEKLADYIISYTINFNKKDVVKTTTVEVKDNLKPTIKVGAYKESVALNDTVTLPTITCADNSNEEIKPTVKVYYKDTKEEVTYKDDTKTSFVASKTGYYTIAIEAKDSTGNVANRNLVIVVRNVNEIEAFDSKEFVSTVGNIGTPNGALVSFNDDPNYIIQGEGSLKFKSTESFYAGTFPEFNIDKPAIKDITSYYSMSFAVYNANPVESEICVADRTDGWTKLAPYSWTVVEIKTDSPVLSGKNWKDEPTAGASNLAGLRLYFNQTMETPMTFYVDNIMANESALVDHIGDINNTDGVFVNEEFTVKVFAPEDKITANLLNMATGERTPIPAESNKLKISEMGKYSIEYIYQDGTDVQTFYDKFAVKPTNDKAPMVMDDFENHPDLYYGCNGQTMMEISNEHVIDGEQSLKFTISKWDGFPYIYVDKSEMAKYIDVYDYVTLRIYNDGTLTHGMNINNIKSQDLVPGLNEIKLSNEDFKAMVNNDAAADEADTAYQTNKFTFLIFNATGVANEPFSVWFDSFTGGYNDLDAVAGKEFNVAEKFPGYTLTSIVATKGEETITAVDGKLTFTQGGTYELVLTGKRANSLEGQIKVNVNVVDLNKPEITIGDHNDTVDLNSEFVMPGITITDNIDTNLEATIKVFFGEEEITLTDNKFLAAKEGVYRIVVSTVDTSGNETTVEFNITSVYPYEKNALTINDFEAGVGNYYSDSKITLSASAEHAVNGKQSLEASFTAEAGYNWIRTDKAEFTKYFDLYDYVVLHMYSTGSLAHRMWINETRLPDLKPGLNRIVLINNRFKQCVNNDEIAFGIDKSLYEVGKTSFSFDNVNANEAFKVYFDAFEGGYNLRADINKEFDLAAALPGYTISSVKATMGETALESTTGKLTFTETGKYDLAINGKRGDGSEARFYLELTAAQFALNFESDDDKSPMTPEHVGASEISTAQKTAGNSSFRMYNLPADYPQFGINDSITNASDMEYIEFDILLTTTEINRFVRKGHLKFWGSGWGPDEKLYTEVYMNQWHTVTIAKSVLEAEIAAGHNLFYFVTFNVGSGDNDITDPSLEMFVDCVRYSKVATGDLIIK